MRNAVRAIILRDDKLLLMHRNKNGREYFALIGGGIEPDETPEEALVREVHEEASLQLVNYRLVFIEQPDTMYGTQHIFLCDDPGGEVKIRDDAVEVADIAAGHNTYTLAWVPISRLASLPLLSAALKDAIISALQNGWPDSPKTLQPSVDMRYTT